jgi:hypothetical protein
MQASACVHVRNTFGKMSQKHSSEHARRVVTAPPSDSAAYANSRHVQKENQIFHKSDLRVGVCPCFSFGGLDIVYTCVFTCMMAIYLYDGYLLA